MDSAEPPDPWADGQAITIDIETTATGANYPYIFIKLFKEPGAKVGEIKEVPWWEVCPLE